MDDDHHFGYKQNFLKKDTAKQPPKSYVSEPNQQVSIPRAIIKLPPQMGSSALCQTRCW
jgi:hypothetical protein